jgi:hypothetical protein
VNRKPNYVSQAQWNYGSRVNQEQKARTGFSGAHYLALQVQQQERRNDKETDQHYGVQYQTGDYEPYDGQE